MQILRISVFLSHNLSFCEQISFRYPIFAFLTIDKDDGSKKVDTMQILLFYKDINTNVLAELRIMDAKENTNYKGTYENNEDDKRISTQASQ